MKEIKEQQKVVEYINYMQNYHSLKEQEKTDSEIKKAIGERPQNPLEELEQLRTLKLMHQASSVKGTRIPKSRKDFGRVDSMPFSKKLKHLKPSRIMHSQYINVKNVSFAE